MTNFMLVRCVCKACETKDLSNELAGNILAASPMCLRRCSTQSPLKSRFDPSAGVYIKQRFRLICAGSTIDPRRYLFSLSLSPLLLARTTTPAAPMTSFRHAGRQIPAPCLFCIRNSNVAWLYAYIHLSVCLSVCLLSMPKAFKCLGVGAAYAVCVSTTAFVSRRRFIRDIYICESIVGDIVRDGNN